MKLDEIMSLWEEDSNVDRTALGDESIAIPKLHAKYYRLFMQERMALYKHEADLKVMYRKKHEYYNGTLSNEELQEHGWQPFALKVLKADLPIYIEADPDLINIQSKIAVQKEKVSFIESIIKGLTNRGFQIRAAIDFMKFQHGVSWFWRRAN